MANEVQSVRVRIEGRVQGVGFRAFVARNAARLGLDGWVRNRRDGSVEAVFAGSRPDVAEMIADCERGPRGASVALVHVEDEADRVARGFAVTPTV